MIDVTVDQAVVARVCGLRPAAVPARELTAAIARHGTDSLGVAQALTERGMGVLFDPATMRLARALARELRVHR